MVDFSSYKAIILAGGRGTRLYPVTYEIPKPLLPVKRKPIINYLVNLFLDQGIKDIAVLINNDFREEFDWWKKRYYPEDIKNNFKINFFEEAEPLGTFGGIWNLKQWIGNSPFFLTNGDELKKIDLGKMAVFHAENQVLATIALVSVPNPQDYGVAICEGNFIKEFLEKPKNPPSNYINSGLYLFSPKILNDYTSPKFIMVEKDVFPNLAKKQKLAGFKFSGAWTDCGNFARWENAIKSWQEN
ncbi:MAG: nucleotidyltransferase family protein [Candidatus Pacebacteria bacterium]|nr:nucleotidyltransferase family protein [Candidatus Paceibacterota bacterium]